MSDNVTEIAPKLSEPQMAADGTVVRVDEEGWEHPQSPPTGQEESMLQTLRVGVIGKNTLADATAVAFNTKAAEFIRCESFADVDALIDAKPTIVFVCEEIPLLKNDTFDDADFLNAINKLFKQTECAICIRSTLNIETTNRLIATLGYDVFQAKLCYFPELSDCTSMADILVSDYHMIGGEEKPRQSLLQLLQHASHFSASAVTTGSIWEVIYAKLGLAGFKAVKQTFFNQLYDTILDVKNANPTIVRRMMEQAPDIADKSVMVPTFVRAKTDDSVSYKEARGYAGEFLNHDVRALAGLSDKLPLIDECINFKNLKD